MLESVLIESTHSLRTKTRYTAIASIAIQAIAAIGFVLLPLLHPEALPKSSMIPALILPPPAPVKVPPVPQAPTHPRTAAPQLDNALRAPSQISHKIDLTPDPAPPTVIGSAPSMAPSGPIGELFTTAAAPIPTVTPTPTPKPQHVNISEGVSKGLLLNPIKPIYPAIARAAHVQGTVVIQATISKAGSIESLRIISGPAMLSPAALEAVKAARYQPYKLNGEPVEVQTTITIHFTMES